MSNQLFNISTKNLSAVVFTAALTALITTLSSPVQAITFVTQRADLAGNDEVDWSSLGKVFNPFAPPDPSTFLPNSFSAASENGLGLNVDIPPSAPSITPPFVFQTVSAGIETNFADGDFVLFTGLMPGIFPSPGNPGPLSISFDTPVKAAGSQIAVDDTPSFTAFISAFDSSDTLLGTFSAMGTSSLALDNSALFLGVNSDTPNIKRLVFSASEPERAIGINTLSLKTAPVPETDSVMALSLFGLSLLAFKKQGKRQ